MLMTAIHHNEWPCFNLSMVSVVEGLVVLWFRTCLVPKLSDHSVTCLAPWSTSKICCLRQENCLTIHIMLTNHQWQQLWTTLNSSSSTSKGCCSLWRQWLKDIVPFFLKWIQNKVYGMEYSVILIGFKTKFIPITSTKVGFVTFLIGIQDPFLPWK